MTVADLILAFQQHDPHATVVVADPEYRGVLTNLLNSEVRAVCMWATDETVLPFMRVAEDGPSVGTVAGKIALTFEEWHLAMSIFARICRRLSMQG
jgi:hypothetical protein